MTPKTASVFAAIALVCMTTPGFAQKGPTNNSASCDASAQAVWPEGVIASGSVSGPCQAADMSLTLTNASGDVIWHDTFRSNRVFEFNSATNAVEMQATLELWLGDYADMRTAGTLPEWLPGWDTPVGSEFPFYVDLGVTRDAYIAAREADRPMVCYAQGLESARCLIIAPGGTSVETLGVQSFPG
jgi:hypothetical protein